MTAFFSPLAGTSVGFNLEGIDYNLKLLISALISSIIVTGLVIGRELDKHRGNTTSN